MSIRRFTRFMTGCPQMEFNSWLIPVAVVMVIPLVVLAALVALAAAFCWTSYGLAALMDLFADTAKILLGVSLVEPETYGNGRPTKIWNSFCARLDWLVARLFVYN